MSDMTIKKIINIALETGKIMLQNGAETYRVEETIEKMISSRIDSHVEVFVMSTGIIISVESEDTPFTTVSRIASSGIDMEYIARANSFSRVFTEGRMSLEEANIMLKQLKSPPRFPKKVRFFFSGMAGGFVVLLFNGSFIEFILAYIASSFTVFFTDKLSKMGFNFFIKNIIGGFIAGGLGILLVLFMGSFNQYADYNKVILGPLMTLVPGVALTNGIRDLISGELIAGSAKMMEALFIAIALAFGVGIVLQIVLSLS
ncbi:MAG: threonine/serine exporter family protein [Gudongella sp.]|nr:threonine/serine exporter family protein [Gudongella sp.]